MDSHTASEKVSALQRIGEELMHELNYERYDLWNESTLRILDLIFGQPSDPYMSFKFPGGGEAANSREGRVKNAITQKLKVLAEVQDELDDNSLRPKFGWGNSADEIEKAITGLLTS